MKVRITQLDGKLPNFALMRLASWHRRQGDQVYFERSPRKHFDEPEYDRVYGSAIFEFSRDRVSRFRRFFPDAVLGGTGTDSSATVESVVGDDHFALDYSIDSNFTASMGFTQRGCRLTCAFCCVPTKEGKPYPAQTIEQIWRGPGFPKHIHLLDNDFFSIPDWWKERVFEIAKGKFKVCFSQGINVRVINEDVARAIASVDYRDDSFTKRRLYTAWDNIGHENAFFRGVDRLERNGVPPTHLLVYMLVGFAKDETWEAIMYRFERMKARGIRPYPMVFDCRSTDPRRYRRLKQFQRWAVTGIHRFASFDEYDPNARGKRR